MDYWEDRVSKEQHDKISAALEHLETSAKSTVAQQVCYDELTNNGMTPEEADEMINLTLQG